MGIVRVQPPRQKMNGYENWAYGCMGFAWCFEDDDLWLRAIEGVLDFGW